VSTPKGTRFWLKSRFLSRRNERRVIEFYKRRMQIHRLFRGLVLGGGGARGAAHIGMLKSIQEAGIPLTSLWCSSRDISAVAQKARTYFHRLATRFLLPLLDITYPYTSILTGNYFNYTLRETFEEDLYIEDLWLPFFCVRGCTLGEYSGRRTSPHDGCYVNNVPGDIMARQQCKYILAIDVATLDDRNLYDYGDSLSGWWVLWKKLNPFSSSVKIPDQSEIQLRLAFCSHYKNLEELKSNPNYEYIQPPVDRYLPGNFNMFDDILEVGYHHGKTYFTGLRKACELFSHNHRGHHVPPWLPARRDYKKQWAMHHQRTRLDSEPPYSFTDLAELVCQSTRDSSDLEALRSPKDGSHSSKRKTSSSRKQHSSGNKVNETQDFVNI
ncbi:Uncharacterized protein FKW44_020826, partial [Caligus rogercresseyi]